jgi:zinc protease
VEPLVGLAALTAEMLRRGAGQRSTEEIAEAIEFVGGSLSVETDTDYTAINVRVLREHLDLALELVGDLVQRPRFPEDELEKQRRRELDRLSLMRSQPRWLARQAFYRTLYGESHPYAYYDAEPESLRRVTRADVVQFHQSHYVPRNAFLLVVGDTRDQDVAAKAQRFLGDWPDRPAPAFDVPSPPTHEGREIVVVHQPGNTQAQIVVGNLALSRGDPQYLRLRLANQVLGGSASARLFMNLRERCSYSYGVYSSVSSRAGQAPLAVGGAVEARHTAGALREIFRELDRIRQEPAPADELGAARDYLVGSFPAMTETAGNIAELVTIQRVFALASDYWSTYRSGLIAVDGASAQQAAQQYIQPDQVTMVIVGDAEVVVPPAREYGAVRVVAADGRPIESFPRRADDEAPVTAEACAESEPSASAERVAEPPAGSTPRDMDFPQPREQVLSNGLPVLTIEKHQLPLVHVRLVVRAGQAADLSVP